MGACVLGLMWVWAGCAAQTQRHGAVSGPAGTDRALTADLRAILGGALQGGGTMAMQVQDGRSGVVLAAERAQENLLPASTLKLVTAATLLTELDRSARLHTSVMGAAPDGEGVIRGPLWLVGDGDPALGSGRGMAGQPAHEPSVGPALTEAAMALVAAGVRRVDGDVVGDGRVLGRPQYPPGWSWDDLAYAYAALPSGLTAHEAAVELRVDGNGRGSPGAVLNPATSQLRVYLEHAADIPPGLLITPGGAPGDVLARWNPTGTGAHPRDFLAVPDPPRAAAEALWRALKNAGVEVTGGFRAAGPNDGAPDSSTVFHVMDSPTLEELSGLMLRHSLNLHAEVLLMQLGRYAAQDASTRGGLTRVTSHLIRLGLDPTAFRLVDGSGLSRMNLLPASALTAVLMDAVRAGIPLERLLATPGGPGTLEKRLLGTPAEGHLWVKTGSMTGHRNVAGLAHTRSGRTVVFAFMLAGITVPAPVANAALDQAMLRLCDL